MAPVTSGAGGVPDLMQLVIADQRAGDPEHHVAVEMLVVIDEHLGDQGFEPGRYGPGCANAPGGTGGDAGHATNPRPGPSVGTG